VDAPATRRPSGLNATEETGAANGGHTFGPTSGLPRRLWLCVFQRLTVSPEALHASVWLGTEGDGPNSCLRPVHHLDSLAVLEVP
jgi:hypothetical protein